MNSVLIFKDLQRIESCKQVVTEATPYLQAVYDGFRKVGITVTVVQIVNLQRSLSVQTKQCYDKNQFGQPDPATVRLEYTCDLSGTVRNLMVETKEVPTFAGLPLSKEKLKELVELPDLSELETAFVAFSRYVSGLNTGTLQADIYEVSDDKVKPLSDTDERITERFSHYATTSKQIELTEHLTGVADVLNSYYEFMQKKGYIGSSPEYPEIQGLARVGSVFGLDYRYIQEKA